MNKKTEIMTKGVDDSVQGTLQALDRAGVSLFVELVDSRTEYARTHNYPKTFKLSFYTLDPAGI